VALLQDEGWRNRVNGLMRIGLPRQTAPPTIPGLTSGRNLADGSWTRRATNAANADLGRQHAYEYCFAAGTLVLMADGGWPDKTV
jgi:hypothetical protein